ncbi:DinB family protein [Desertivirga xinjiangensis]|uniref:DinB family protein n=1 Tax=Desertivirga xinjiangensis TaxID=539206 RepID=UPI00210D6EB4|nr:DinB family protein [Pedobacter xinjiangensis]
MLPSELTNSNFSMNLHSHSVERFCNQHKTIKNYIDDLPPEAIYNRLSQDRFSIHETIAYLTRYQHIFMERINRIVNEVNPYFEIYKPDLDPEFNFTNAKTTGSLLHELYRLRNDLMLQFEEMPSENYARVGTHAVLGRMNVSQWIEFFLLHESNQLFKIFKMAGSFWSMELGKNDNVIYLPRLSEYIDELAV